MASLAMKFVDCLLTSTKADDSEKAMLHEYFDGRVQIIDEKAFTGQALDAVSSNNA